MRNLNTIGLSLVIALSASVPQLALAQGSSALDVITVTSQRREQSQQEVPIAVTTFSGDSIEQQNITGAIDFLARTPNVSFTEDGQFGKRGLGISIRGVNNLISGENAAVPSVGVYLDDFSVASVPNQVANPFLPDMERIEVLRGPQGTLFGRNSLGGALNMTTRDPGDEFEGSVRVGAESYDDAGEMFNITGIIGGPIADNFRVRGVLKLEDSDGTVENACASGASVASCPFSAENGFTPNGEENSGHEYIMARVKAIWDITPDTQGKLTLMYTNEEQGTDENVPSGILDLDTVDTLGITTAIDPGTGFWPSNRNRLSHDLPERNDLETLVAIVNVSHKFSENSQIKWITGLIDAEFDRLFDNDLVGGVDTLSRTNSYEGESWSTEVRFENTSDQFDWVVGLLYANDEQTQANNVAVSTQATATAGGVGWLPPFPNGLGLARNNKVFEAQQIALFGDLTWRITNELELIAGARVTRDEVDDSLAAFGLLPGPGGPPTFTNTPRPSVSGSEDFTDFSPRLGVRYAFTDDVSGYATVSKGYKAGGTSLGNNTNQPGDPGFTVPFDEEELYSFEVGVKTELFDNTLRFNAAAFYLDWRDLQFESFRFLTPGDLSSNFEQTINIDDAEVMGIELEWLWAPIDGLTIDGSLGWQDSEITSNTTAEITGGFVVNLKGLDIPKAPDLTFNLNAEYRWPMLENEAWVRLEFISREGQYSDIEGVTNAQTRGPSPSQGLIRTVGPGEFPYLSPDYDLFNLRAGFDMDNWLFGVYIQNLTDEEYYTGTQENFGASGIRLRPHPMTIGGSVTFRFGG